jgi:hypothetical protein
MRWVGYESWMEEGMQNAVLARKCDGKTKYWKDEKEYCLLGK